MAKAGLRSANRSRTLLGTLTLSGSPHMPITTSHMPSDMADQVPGNSISKRETFFGIRARVGWAWHHVSGHPSSRPYTAAAFYFFFNYFWFTLGAPCWEAVWGLTVPYWQLEGERRRRRRCPRGARRAHPEVPRVPRTSRNHPMSSTIYNNS